MHTLLILEPSHFHAALALAAPQPLLARRVHVYARPGAELRDFLGNVSKLNRALRPESQWIFDVHESETPTQMLIEERRGDVVLLANRNDEKLPILAHLHQSGFHVLADKPWILNSDSLPYLDRVTAKPPLAMDMMTGSHDPLARLLSRMVAHPVVFGAFVTEVPAIEIEAVHHLCKVVAGAPVRRPPWYYDVNVQGDGMVDLHSHMVDDVLRLLGAGSALEPEPDFEVRDAQRYSTPVPLDVFRESTGEGAFPSNLADRIEGDTLRLACNGYVEYRLAGILVRQRAEWRPRQPPNGGDSYRSLVRGSCSSVEVTTGPETGFRPQLDLLAASPRCAAAVEKTLEVWTSEFSGLEVERAGKNRWVFRIEEPDSEHEHLPDVLAEFLSLVDRDAWSAEIAGRIRLRYTLISRARDRALARSDAEASPSHPHP